MKNTVKLNEDALKQIVAESVKKCLNEKYNPWKRVEDEEGEISFPRYDKDTLPYRNRLIKQSAHLYKQIEFFLQTLEHAYPNLPNTKIWNPNTKTYYNDTHRTGYPQDVEDALIKAQYKLRRYMDPDVLFGFDHYGMD